MIKRMTVPPFKSGRGVSVNLRYVLLTPVLNSASIAMWERAMANATTSCISWLFTTVESILVVNEARLSVSVANSILAKPALYHPG